MNDVLQFTFANFSFKMFLKTSSLSPTFLGAWQFLAPNLIKIRDEKFLLFSESDTMENKENLKLNFNFKLVAKSFVVYNRKKRSCNRSLWYNCLLTFPMKSLSIKGNSLSPIT